MCVPCSLLPQGSQPWGGVVQGASVWIPFACSPHENFSWLLSQPPFRLGGGGGGEREKRNLEEYLIHLYSRNPLSSAINSSAFIDNSSVYSCNSSFISFIYGDLDGWAGPLLAWAILYLLRWAVLKHILSPPLLRLQELDRPAGLLTSAIPTVWRPWRLRITTCPDRPASSEVIACNLVIRPPSTLWKLLCRPSHYASFSTLLGRTRPRRTGLQGNQLTSDLTRLTRL